MRHLIALSAAVCLYSATSLIAQENRSAVYDFGAKWCGPCQQVAPIVEKLQREGLPIKKVDIDEQKDLANRFQVTQIPTFVLVINGKEVDRTTGRLTEADLRRMVARIPQTPPQVAAPAAPQQIGPMSIPVQLGEPGMLNSPASTKPELPQTRVAENDQKRSLRDLIPFGRKTTEAPKEVIRGNDSPLAPAGAGADLSSATAVDPMQSSVRIRVITNGRIDLGSGTVILSKSGESKILTCAHIFKEFTDDSRIEVDVFERGGTSQYTASLEKFDAASDLGLISIPAPNPIAQVRIAGQNAAPRVGADVIAIGCSGGDDPTRQQSQVTDIDKYEGPHNLLCTGVPVRGRSGGGLFNTKGEVIGVCSAADEQEQRGFYSGLLAIHKLLDQCNLTALYAPTEKPIATPSQELLAAGSLPASRDFPETAARSLPAAAPVTTQPSLGEHAESGPMDVQAGDAEVVVIIRDRANPKAANRVVILHEASPKFMSYLSGELPDATLNMDTLGAIPATSASRAMSQPAAPEMGSQLRETTLSKPVVPQRFIRSASSRLP